MKSFNCRLLLVAVTGILLSLSATAQTDEPAVKTCLEHYMSGDGNRMEIAFHPSATMKYIDYKTVEFKDVPIAEFIARAKANTTKSERTIEIVSMNVEGTAAQAKIKIETAQAILYDYMNLLKINGEWKIVSKIFSRKDK